MKKVNPAVIAPLKNALSSIYWYKDDLIGFLLALMPVGNEIIVRKIDKNKTKYQIAADFVNELMSDEEKYQEVILNTIEAICGIESFSHFNAVENGPDLKQKALVNVAVLRKEAQSFLGKVDSRKMKETAIEIQRRMAETKKDFNLKISELRDKYFELSKLKDYQKRGYELEKFLIDLFQLFDIESKRSFRIDGEQIDGAFTLESFEFLVEAKWQTTPVNKSDIFAFMGKVNNKLKNTLGLLVSINGFSEQNYSANEIDSVILCDSFDLVNVLEGRIDLKEMIRRKKQEAARTGNVFFRVI